VLLLAASCGLLLALAAFRLHAYRSDLEGYALRQMLATREFPGLSVADVVQLGTAHTADRRPASSYLNFDLEKPAGVTRIGVFGCSYVFGSEVPEGADFPSWLAGKFPADARVQVINFGVGGHGTHQAYEMMLRVGSRYALDVAVLNFLDFHRARDSSFVGARRRYGPLHARYVLSEGELQRVPVVGATRLDAAQRYFSLLPPWRYWRYDARATPLLRSLVPGGRELAANPFYYADEIAEADRIYAAIVDDWADRVGMLVVACNGPEGCGFRKQVANPAVVWLGAESATRAAAFPGLYLAPNGHLSGFANQWVAAELHALLSGKGGARSRRIALAARAGSAKEPGSEPLHAGRLMIGDDRVAELVVAEADVARFRHRPVEFGGRPVRGLLDLSSGSHLRFAPLETLPRAGQTVTLQMRVDGVRTAADLGYIAASASNVLRIEPRSRTLLDANGEMSLRAGGEISQVAVRIGSQLAMRGQGVRRTAAGGTVLQFSTEYGPLWVARASTERPIDVAELSQSGTLDWVWQARGREAVREPLYDYRVESMRLQRFARALPTERSVGVAPRRSFQTHQARDAHRVSGREAAVHR
jgi:hypothetical protein